MESLRRLTSSVFRDNTTLDTMKHDNESSTLYSLCELSTITKRLILVGMPHDGATNKKYNVVNVDDLITYLDTLYANHYMFFNLNTLENVTTVTASEVGDVSVSDEEKTRRMMMKKKTSIVDKLHEQILEFDWERDGMKAHTPPLDLIFRICYALDAWLSLDVKNIALIHCRTGKTRSAVVVACYLLYARLATDPIDAFAEFYRKRWDQNSLTSQALRNKTPPSIQRFLASFYQLRTTHKPQNDKPLLLKAIIFRQLPVELQPCVQIWDDYKRIFCTDDALRLGESGEVPVLDWNEEDGYFAILWETGVELDGGFSVLCSFGEEYDRVDDVDASLRVLFRYVDSTLFLMPGLVTLKKHDLDMMKQYEHGFDKGDFSVDLLLHENSSKKPRSLVRMDYSGNSAVRQGLTEITKHHVVLPDPAMHSNFIRMGFCETPTTFALQCSQNTPNVALDLLHSKELFAYFVQEVMESAAKNDVEEPAKCNQNVDSPTHHDCRPLLRRHTTAEVVAMQSQRSRYSSTTTAELSVCDTCKKDDYLMRSQIVQCVGRCRKNYHTTCVGLRKIPFSLTTMSDRTNHDVYVKKFFSAWECNACAPKSSSLAVDLCGREIPSNMKPVPSYSVGRVPGTSFSNTQDVVHIGNVHDSLSVAMDGKHQMAYGANGSEEFDQQRKVQVRNGLSIEDVSKVEPSPGTTIASRANASLSSTTLTVTTRPGPSKIDTKTALCSTLNAAKKSSDASETSSAKSVDKYTLMLKRGVPFEAVQNCMQKDLVDPSTLKALANTSDVSSAHEPSKRRKGTLKDVEMFSSYFRMLRMGCPKEAVKHKLIMDGYDPIILNLGPDAISDEVKDQIAIKQSVSNLQDDIKCVKPSTDVNMKSAESELLLKDHKVYAKYFKMLKLGLSEDAVRHKMKVDGVDVCALDLGGKAPISKLPRTAEKEAPAATVNDVRLKDDPKYAKYFKMLLMGLPKDAVRQKMKAEGVNERALNLGGDALVSQLVGSFSGSSVKLQDDPIYAKFFKMLKMGIPKGAVHQKMKSEGIDERALDLGGNALVSDLVAPRNDVRLQDDPVYAKYFKMLKMGLPEGAVRQKMATDNIDVRALELGPDATVSLLDSDGNAKGAKDAAVKPERIRKKLHWQAISEERLSNVKQQTIWEDEDDDVDFDMDMDELEALFFTNQNTGNVKKSSLRGESKVLKCRQTVTLIDGKRAMNAAISLARVKLAYREIAEAVAKFDPSGLTIEQVIGINDILPTSEEAAIVSEYTGDTTMLGEAEKFILEIVKVKRYGPRMECLVLKISFPYRSADLATSLSHLQNASEEVKGSRLLKTLLAVVLKLGNTLNGSAEENEIRGFTVDSLLRLGHTKAINQKTTVLHYLVRLVKKNHPQVLDFQAELQSVPLAARESFETIDNEFKKLRKELASFNTELGLLEKQADEALELEVVIKSMQNAAADFEARMKTVSERIDCAREEVSSVLAYFGEDPKQSSTEFFTTLASFCTMFQQARNVVDSADEAAQRAERLKMRRSNSVRPLKFSSGPSLKVSRLILERPQSDRTAEKRHCDDN